MIQGRGITGVAAPVPFVVRMLPEEKKDGKMWIFFPRTSAISGLSLKIIPMSKQKKVRKPSGGEGNTGEGYPPYPSGEDIYNQDEEVTVPGTDASPGEAPDEAARPDSPNESGDEASHMGDDLDVPGSELDDADESIGEEDEENNYYSLGDNE